MSEARVKLHEAGDTGTVTVPQAKQSPLAELSTPPVEITTAAVLFDNDGVLVDSHAQVEMAWTQLAEEYSLDITQLLAELAGVRAYDTLVRYLKQPALDEAIAALEAIELSIAEQTKALPGAQDLIASLADGRWTIVTSASRVLAQARWAGAGISYPTTTVTADDVSAGKPDPEPFLKGAAVLGVDIAKCLVLEDSDSGGRAGRDAGATVIAVGDAPWSFEPYARVKDLSELRVELEPYGG